MKLLVIALAIVLSIWGIFGITLLVNYASCNAAVWIWEESPTEKRIIQNGREIIRLTSESIIRYQYQSDTILK